MSLSRVFLLFAAAFPLTAFAAKSPAPATPSAPAAAPSSAELPVETFFRTSTISSLVFSPNGKYVACLVPYERRMNLAVIDLEKGTKKLLTNFKDRQAQQPLWANDDRILFQVDDGGKEAFALYAVNRDGEDPTILAHVYSPSGANSDVKARFRSVLRRLEDGKNILVLAHLSYRDRPDVAIMNLKSGTMKKVAEAPGDVEDYILDHENKTRIALVRDGAMRRVLYRDGNGGDWTTLAERHVDAEGWTPLAFDGDNRTLFISSDVGRKTAAIYRYDVETRQRGEMVFGDDTYDVTGVIYDRSKKKIVGVGYEGDRDRFHWIDDEMRALQAKMEASLPNTVHAPRQFSEDGSRIIFASYSDRDPGVYYLFDRKTQKLEELAVTRPWIDPEKMAPKKPVIFTARDGLTIHAYLTLPLGRPAKNLPLVINPHGGPFGIRDSWQYEPEVQFYANRGYAVLQVNYRGSGGYGREFEAAGFKKWGLEMQNDLSDAVKWAIAEGIADPARVIISGGSYGGYATMAGLAFTPELYAAGINYVGVTDIDILIPKSIPERQMHWMHTRLGDPSKAADRKRIFDTSPVNFAERIKAPVLMAYGKNDPRVVIDHGYDMERALKKAGKQFEMIIERDEGHGFRMEEKSVAFYTRVDAFLKRYLPKTTEAERAADAVKKSGE